MVRNDTTQVLEDLKGLIAENYAARATGEKLDEWFWADKLALDLGADLDYYNSLPKWYELNG